MTHSKKKFDEILHINKKKYYNFIFFVIRNKRDILIDFLIVIENYENIITRTRYEYECNVDEILIKRILKQICWMNHKQRYWVKRFCSKFVIKFDAIFNINALKLFFFVNIKIININMIFLMIFFLLCSRMK